LFAGLELLIGEEALRLTGHDHARGILRHGLKHLARKEHHRHLDDGEQQLDEDRRYQCELDGGRTAAVAAKPAQQEAFGRQEIVARTS
jgi:hypothetical protein